MDCLFTMVSILYYIKKECALLYAKIPLAEYEKLTDHFSAHNFDADKITDLAIKVGMNYILVFDT